MAKRDYVEPIKVEGARIVFRNLSGKPDKFNPQGCKRSFALVIDDAKFAQSLIDEGWNIKQFNQRDEDEEPGYYLPVKVNYGNRPPHIYLCSNKTKKLMTEELVGTLDYAEIANVDIVVTPSFYENVGGRSGISAYVKTMYVTVVEDDFADKYNYDDEDDDTSDEVPFN